MADKDPEDWGAIGVNVPIHSIPVLVRALKFFERRCMIIEEHEYKQIDNLLTLLECYNDDRS